MSKNSNHLADTGDGITVARTEGSLIYDIHGKRYIDFTSGWCVGNLGWSQKAIRKAIRDFDGPAYVQPGHAYEPWEELAGLLAELAPGKLSKCYRATGGTEAVEIALQLAMTCTGRRKFVSIEGCYHGNSIGTRSIAASDELENHLPGCLQLAPPLHESASGRLETLLKNKDVAAFIMEPIICNLGVLIPDEAFMLAAQRLCHRYGTLLVMDEVATGLGRTGKLFASEHFDIEPDIICLAKAITGGYAPMGATLVTEKVFQKAEGEEFYSTYGWHPLSVAAALTNLNFIRKNREDFFRHVSAMSEVIEERLSEIDFGCPAELRVRGLAIGVELESEKIASNIKDKCKKAGLLISLEGKALTFFPALTIEEKLVHEALDILEDCAGHKQKRPARAA